MRAKPKPRTHYLLFALTLFWLAFLGDNLLLMAQPPSPPAGFPSVDDPEEVSMDHKRAWNANYNQQDFAMYFSLFLLDDDHGGCDPDDHVAWLDIAWSVPDINAYDIFEIAHKDDGEPYYSQYPNQFVSDLNGCSDHTYRYRERNSSALNGEHLGHQVLKGSGSDWDWSAFIKIRIPPYFIGKTVSVIVDGISDENGYRYDATKTFSVPALPVPSNLRATPGCSQVTLNWDAPFNFNGYPSDFVYVIYRGGTEIGTTNSSNRSYVASTTSSSSQTYEVGIRYTRTDSYTMTYNSNRTSVSAAPTPAPDVPSGLTASDDRCDTEIRLSWSYNTNPSDFKIFRSTSSSSGFAEIATVGGSSRSFTNTGIIRGQQYFYRITAVNGCNTQSSQSPSEGGYSVPVPSAASNFRASLQTSPEVGVNLTWSTASNATRYQIIRRNVNGGEKTFDISSGSTTSYFDRDVLSCESYEYEIVAINACASSSRIKATLSTNTSQSIVHILNIDISTALARSNIRTSKGYFGNRITLDWDLGINATHIDRFQIYRRQLGTTVKPELVLTMPSGSAFAEDTRANARVLYEYFVVGENDCGTVAQISYDINQVTGRNFNNLNLPANGVAYGVGFRLPLAVVNGTITYEGGIAVPDVRVVAERETGVSGSSLQFNGNGSAVISTANMPTLSKEFTISAWVRRVNNNVQRVFYWPGFLDVFFNSGNLVAAVKGTSLTAALPLNEYTHLAITTGADDTVKIFINGKMVSSARNTSTISVTSQQLQLGAWGSSFFWNGNLDEVRMFNRELQPSEMLRDFGRVIAPNTPGLMGYWRMDESAGDRIYDISQNAQGEFQRRDGTLTNAVWSNAVPTAAQLGYAGYTDANGNYTITGIIYEGNGENFKVTPTMTLGGAIHEFNPSLRVLFLGEGRSVENGVDFKDISSFRVTGTVVFDFTDRTTTTTRSSGSEGVLIYIDGKTAVTLPDGNFYKTGVNGQFDIQVPIGRHFLEFRKAGHTFANAGKWPTSRPEFDFQAPVTGVEMLDRTLHKFVGRVVGGTREGNKPVGFALSTNNIGRAKFTLTSQDGIIIRDLVTNGNTGEFEIMLPPKRYNFSSIRYNANNVEIISSGNIEALDLGTKAAYDGAFDTRNRTVNNTTVTDTVKYAAKRVFLHRVRPTLTVTKKDGTPFKGEETVVYEWKGTRYEIPTASMDFHVLQNGRKYDLKIGVVETYTNIENLRRDNVPVTDGDLEINNNIGLSVVMGADGENYESTVPKVLPIMQADGDTVYTFIAADPNINEVATAGQQHLSFTKQMIITFKTDKHAVTWPNPNNAIEPYRAYVLGGKLIGNSFVTKGPDMVETILRDPPGSASSTTLERGETFFSTSSVLNGGFGNVTIEKEFGSVVKAVIGVPGAQTIEEQKNSVKVRIAEELSGSDAEETTTSTTTTVSFTTNGEADELGGQADIFLTASDNFETGLSVVVTFIPEELCNGKCYGKTVTVNGKNFRLGKVGTSYVKPEGTPTYTVYTANQIENILIPDLKEIRSSILARNPAYTSKIPADHALYGTNNDDPVWGTLRVQNDYRTTQPADATGPSYTFDAAKQPAMSVPLAPKVDSVRWINQQIRLWEEALAMNEIEKWEAITFTPQEDKENISLAAGVVYAKSISTTESSVETSTFESVTSLGMNTENGFNLFGVAFEIDIEAAAGYVRETNDVEGEETSVTFGYELSDPDEANLLSIDVYPGKGNNGPIFRTVAGQTSCPYEDEVKMRFVTPHYLDALIEERKVLVKEIETRFPNIRPEGEDRKRDLYKQQIDRYTQLKSAINAGKILLSNKTLQIEKPSLLINGTKAATAYNVPSGAPAFFQLTLVNESESEDDVEYALQIADATNPDGLVVTIDGVPVLPGRTFLVPGGSAITKTLQVERGPFAFEYEEIALSIISTCDGDIADSVKFSVNFIPTCTQASIIFPTDKWTANYEFNDTIPVTVSGYDINFVGLETVKIQYKPSSKSEWTLMATYYRDEDVREALEGPEDGLVLPKNGNVFTHYWDIEQLPDGQYDIRVITNCDLTNNTSAMVSGIVDRVNPHAFGAPQPADGVLAAGDEIMVQFNEPINAGLLRPSNFDIRGVLNGVDLRHPASVYFNGTGSDFMEIPEGILLTRRSLTIEFYAKRKANGQAVMVSHGFNDVEGFRMGFDANDRLQVRMAGEEITGEKSITDNFWHHYAFVFDIERNTAQLFIDGLLEKTSNAFAPDYTSLGKTVVGRAKYGNLPAFNGNIHEFRIWKKPLSLGEINIYAVKRLTSNTPGLAGNWQMEEAFGTQAEDLVNERHATVRGTWEVEPNGHSLSFADGGYLASKSPAMTNEMNFTIEFWYKGQNVTNATLVSNGRGDTVQNGQGEWLDANRNGWAIRANAQGQIEVWNRGRRFLAVPENTFDGQWHHFAFVVNRRTNATAFVDGLQKGSMLAAGWSGFGGSFLWLGSRGWFEGTEEKHDEFFSGQMDEFRVWRAARSAEQIKRDMRYMLDGNEPGLLFYHAFDRYVADAGIMLLEPTMTTISTDPEVMKDVSQGLGNVQFSDLTPTIKLPRPVQKVNFNYSANQDKIILTTNDPDSLLENVILDITINGVQDLNGNFLQSPVTWTAFVDRNQVGWEDEDFAFTVEQGKGLTFESRIRNEGGKFHNFLIKNLPPWLKAEPMSGTIAPMSSQRVVFTVDANVNIGNYLQDIQMVTEFGFEEVLLLNLKVFKALPADWRINPDDYQFSMNVVAQVDLNGEISRDPDDQVAAFVGDECRGIAKLRYVPEFDNYQAFINLYSNEPNGSELVTFRVWNASDGQVHLDVTPTYTFVANKTYGTPANPEMLKAFLVVEAKHAMPKGWKWVSFHLHTDAFQDLDQALGSIEATNGDVIKGIDVADSYDSQEGWQGTLSLSGGIRNGHSYKMFLNSRDTLAYKGRLLKGEEVPIDLVPGWNWVGYIGFKAITVEQALGSLAHLTDGDVIKSQFAAAYYVNNVGWVGDLTHLRPGEGYMMRMTQADRLTFPNLSFAAGERNAAEEAAEAEVVTDAPWQVEWQRYRSNMNLVVEIIGENNAHSHSRLAVMVGEECRGVASPVFNPITQRTSYFLTAYADRPDETLTFAYLKGENGQIFGAAETVVFQTDRVQGSVQKPIQLTLSGEGQRRTFDALVYPNPFGKAFTLDVFAPEATNAHIWLYDLSGALLQTREVRLEAGKQALTFEGDQLPSGVYLMKIQPANGTPVVRRITKQ